MRLFASLLLAAALPLAAPIPPAQAQPTPVNFTTLHLDGKATATSDVLTLVNGQTGAFSTAWIPTEFDATGHYIGSFDLTLAYAPTSFLSQGDGAALVLQNQGLDAVGTAGNIGAGNIQNGIAAGFFSFTQNYAAIFQTNTASPTPPPRTPARPSPPAATPPTASPSTSPTTTAP